MKNNLVTKFKKISLSTPLLNAAGCFGDCFKYEDIFDPNDLGAIITKGITFNARNGNNGIRVAETNSGMINSVGLENEGIDKFINTSLEKMSNKLTSPIIINISGSKLEDYVACVQKVDKCTSIAAIELNISCPNVKEGGMAFGADFKSAATITAAVRAATTKPLIVKLTPNVTDIVKIALAVEEAGADAISLINTVLAMKIDIKKQKPMLGNITGGLSGPAIKPIAIRMIYQASQKISIPIFGIGGCSNLEDVIEFMMAGASFVQIGTALFNNPNVILEITSGLISYCNEHNINNINELVGLAHNDNGIGYRERMKQHESK